MQSRLKPLTNEQLNFSGCFPFIFSILIKFQLIRTIHSSGCVEMICVVLICFFSNLTQKSFLPDKLPILTNKLCPTNDNLACLLSLSLLLYLPNVKKSEISVDQVDLLLFFQFSRHGRKTTREEEKHFEASLIERKQNKKKEYFIDASLIDFNQS